MSEIIKLQKPQRKARARRRPNWMPNERFMPEHRGDLSYVPFPKEFFRAAVHAAEANNRNVIVWIWEAVLDNASHDLDDRSREISTLHDGAHGVMYDEEGSRPCPKH
jgi:hypothetical protein